MFNSIVSTVLADILAPLDVKSSAGKVTTDLTTLYRWVNARKT